MRVQIHEKMFADGYTEGRDVTGAVYWAHRVAENIAVVRKYDPARQKLLEILWYHVRFKNPSTPAINKEGVERLVWWVEHFTKDFSDKQQKDLRTCVEQIESLRKRVLDA